MAAYLTADYDLPVQDFIYRQKKRAYQSKTIVTKEAGRTIRKTFHLSMQWCFTGVIRADIN